MRFTKLGAFLIGVILISRYVPSYYNSWLFKDFVEQESQRARAVNKLKETIVTKAQSFSLPVDESDVVITKEGSIYRVNVNYSVPVDLFVYSPELKFRVVAAGLIRK
jgi:hypothetical protein